MNGFWKYENDWLLHDIFRYNWAATLNYSWQHLETKIQIKYLLSHCFKILFLEDMQNTHVKILRVMSQKWAVMYMCVSVIDFASISLSFLLDLFGWFVFLIFNLWHLRKIFIFPMTVAQVQIHINANFDDIAIYRVTVISLAYLFCLIGSCQFW
jgi:hypothetical protein